MSREVVQTILNKNIFVDIQWRSDPLRKHVRNVIVGIRPVVKLRPESSLPFLSLHHVVRVRRVKHESFKLQLADAREFWPHLERQFSIFLI